MSPTPRRAGGKTGKLKGRKKKKVVALMTVVHTHNRQTDGNVGNADNSIMRRSGWIRHRMFFCWKWFY